MAKQNGEATPLKKCFVIMPLSDVVGYDSGHFARVFEYLIRPAAKAAGFDARRANDSKSTNHIILDVVEQVYEADLVICDMSSLNPNSMYELGIRQAFDKPVVILKDRRTPRIFDIQGIRDVEYDEDLRIDRIRPIVDQISETITETVTNQKTNINSVVRLLGIKAAQVKPSDVDANTANLLIAINSLREEVLELKQNRTHRSFLTPPMLDAARREFDAATKEYLLGKEGISHGRPFVVESIANDGSLIGQFRDGRRAIVHLLDLDRDKT